MLSNRNDRALITEKDSMGGRGTLTLDKLLSAPNAPEMLRTFAAATLEPGAAVGYHIHTGESESYYFLSGEGQYNDNGKLVSVSAGDVTFTPDGEGHGIANVGETPLEFIALIIKDAE